jgi:spore maturation protein CgeB
MRGPRDIVLLGLSITSSWGNGHATTYRGLVRELARRGHRVAFLERDMPWYAAHRDLPTQPWCETILYDDPDELRHRHAERIAGADAVIVGSYVPQGIDVGRMVCELATGVRAFYDIDTPVTLRTLEAGKCEYIDAELVPRYDLYLSFTGGPALRRIELGFGSPMARALYCSVDPEACFPQGVATRWDLAYMGTYSDDRQPTVDRLLLEVARIDRGRRFAVAGPQYPDGVDWPGNVERFDHLPPAEHASFYSAQRFTLNVTRSDMIAAGHSPSVRIFEAAACGVPIISDRWAGLEELLEPGAEVLLADDTEDVLRYLRDVGDAERQAIAARARRRVLASHTAAHRARELEELLDEARSRSRDSSGAAFQAVR